MSQPQIIMVLIAIATIFWLAWRSAGHGKGNNDDDRSDR
jgi:hypothetical protein